jgi:predicted metal-dependent phosphoesterase TrpH
MQNVSRRRFLQVAAGVGAVTALPGLRSAAFAAQDDDGSRGEWLAGDFHVHTTYSHDVWSGPNDDNTSNDKVYTVGWTPAEQIRNAELRGLDFVALTDHNRTDALTDPGYASSHLVLVPGYEHSLSGGGQHCGVFLPDRHDLVELYAKALSDPKQGTFDNGLGFDGDDGFRTFVDLIHGAGGMCVINHPMSPPWSRGPLVSSRADAIEVWNTTFLSRTDTTGVLIKSVAADNHLSMQWWEQQFLGGGRRKAAVGGSDNHWRSTFAIQGVGQPTTWVFARNRSAEAVIHGVQAGRTFVSAQPPGLGGARLFLSAAARDEKPRRVGQTVPARTRLAVAVDVELGIGNTLRVIAGSPTTGSFVVHAEPVLSPNTRVVVPKPVVLAEGGWLRAELYVDPGYAMSAVTSPIYAAVAGDGTGGGTVGTAEPSSGPPVSYATGFTIPTHLREHVC